MAKKRKNQKLKHHKARLKRLRDDGLPGVPVFGSPDIDRPLSRPDLVPTLLLPKEKIYAIQQTDLADDDDATIWAASHKDKNDPFQEFIIPEADGTVRGLVLRIDDSKSLVRVCYDVFGVAKRNDKNLKRLNSQQQPQQRGKFRKRRLKDPSAAAEDEGGSLLLVRKRNRKEQQEQVEETDWKTTGNRNSTIYLMKEDEEEPPLSRSFEEETPQSNAFGGPNPADLSHVPSSPVSEPLFPDWLHGFDADLTETIESRDRHRNYSAPFEDVSVASTFSPTLLSPMSDTVELG